MDLLQDGAAWLGKTLATSASSDGNRSFRIRFGTTWVPIKATLGKSDFDVIDASGQLTRVVTRDYLVQADELVAGGTKFTPAVGMIIEETYKGETWLHEVVAPDGEHCYRPSDHHRTRIRIHTERRKS